MADEMSRMDATDSYNHFPDHLRRRVGREALEEIEEEFDGLEELIAAGEDGVIDFSWEEFSEKVVQGQLVDLMHLENASVKIPDEDDGGRKPQKHHYKQMHLKGFAPTTPEYAPRLYGLFDTLVWLLMSRMVEKVREIQEQTVFSSREFTALILSESMTESVAADIMDVTVGTYRGKMGRINEKAEQIRNTAALLEEVQSS